MILIKLQKRLCVVIYNLFFLLWFKIKSKDIKNGINGILYRTKAPKLDVLSPTPNPKISVNNRQKIRYGSLNMNDNILNGPNSNKK